MADEVKLQAAEESSEDEEVHGLKRLLLVDMLKILSMRVTFFAWQLRQFTIEELHICFDDLWRDKYVNVVNRRVWTAWQQYLQLRRNERAKVEYAREQLAVLKKW